MAAVENDIARDTLEASNIRTRIERLQRITDGLDEEIANKNDIISKSEAEIVKRNAIIERKQGVIDQYNKKLEHMISSAGVSLCHVWIFFLYSEMKFSPVPSFQLIYKCKKYIYSFIKNFDVIFVGR